MATASQDVARFGKSRQTRLEQFLDLPHGIFSHDPFERVFTRLNLQPFHPCRQSWTQAVSRFTQGAVVSLDGTTVNASFDWASELSPFHMVSAWGSQNGGLVRGQLKTHHKSKGITAIAARLELLARSASVPTLSYWDKRVKIDR